jgi:hypothetical protein
MLMIPLAPGKHYRFSFLGDAKVVDCCYNRRYGFYADCGPVHREASSFPPRYEDDYPAPPVQQVVFRLVASWPVDDKGKFDQARFTEGKMEIGVVAFWSPSYRTIERYGKEYLDNDFEVWSYSGSPESGVDAFPCKDRLVSKLLDGKPATDATRQALKDNMSACLRAHMKVWESLEVGTLLARPLEGVLRAEMDYDAYVESARRRRFEDALPSLEERGRLVDEMLQEIHKEQNP